MLARTIFRMVLESSTTRICFMVGSSEGMVVAGLEKRSWISGSRIEANSDLGTKPSTGMAAAAARYSGLS